MNKNITIGILVVVLAVVAYLIIRPSSPSTQPDPEVLAQLPPETQDYLTSLVDGIQSGGPPKDGIPAVEKPKYESIAKGDEWLQPNDVVFGVSYRGKTIAYPQRIVVYHEIVNEQFGDENVSVTYCPLTGTAIGYKSHSPDASDPTLGVSGKLVNSNLIMYDRATDSYWPQILGGAILGEETGSQLEEFPVTWTTWERWKSVHPETQVLSRSTGFVRNYGVGGDPYGSYLEEDSGYYQNNTIIFSPVNHTRDLTAKTIVIGIRDAERNAVAIVKDTLREKRSMTFSLNDREITLTYDDKLDFYEARYADNDEWINAFDAMWFAWYGYYPETELIQ